MEGGFLFIQHVDLEQNGQKVEVIGHEGPSERSQAKRK
jgi:hypothetical protein